MKQEYKQRIAVGVYAAVMSILTAIALAIAMGATIVEFGELWLIVSMNFLSIPVAFAGGFEIPAWAWYLIALHWIGQIHFLYKWDPELQGGEQ